MYAEQAKNLKQKETRLPIQTSFKIGGPRDKYEQEADKVADHVMRSSHTGSIQMQTEEEEEELQMKCENCEEEVLQMKPEIQFKSGTANEASPELSNKIKSSKGNGSNLSPDLSNEMSSKIGADFNHVNVHTGTDAIQMNQELGSRAFTQGNDIFFNKGEFNPSTSKGKHLFAHELTHVVQQDPFMARKNGVGETGSVPSQLISKQEEDSTRTEQTFEFPGITRMMTPEETQLHIMRVVANSISLAATLESLVLASTQMNITVGLGVQFEGAAVAGIVGSGGYVINDGRIGFYGSYGGDIGAVVGLSAEVVVTVIDGGLERFSGTAIAAVLGGGEVIVGHASLLMPTSGGGFLGVAISGGVGIGLTPVEAYITISNTHAPAN